LYVLNPNYSISTRFGNFNLNSPSGNTCKILPVAQDHKRAYDGDIGANTGGMGAYAPVPKVDEKLLARIHREILDPCLKGMREEGRTFVGVLFAGLMFDAESGKLSVLEFNCR
jgi:phosphoribosylamine-glycine ligase